MRKLMLLPVVALLGLATGAAAGGGFDFGVWRDLQSFNRDDVLYWLKRAPQFGQQAVYLDSVDPTSNPPVPRLTLH